MIADCIDSRVLAKMEVALERACKILSIGADEDSVRRHIASRILEYAERVGGLWAAWPMPDAWLQPNSVRRMVFDEGRFTHETAHDIAPSIDFIRR